MDGRSRAYGSRRIQRAGRRSRSGPLYERHAMLANCELELSYVLSIYSVVAAEMKAAAPIARAARHSLVAPKVRSHDL